MLGRAEVAMALPPETRDRVDRTLDELRRQILDMEAEEIDASRDGDALAIDFPDGPSFRLEPDAATGELRLSANIRQAVYRWTGEDWADAATGESLWDGLRRLLGGRLGHPVTLRRP